jgi:hypothetical protein
MLRNYEEAKQTLMESYANQGYLVEEVNIERLLIRIAVGILMTRPKIKYWLVKNNLLEKHKEYLKSLITLDYE